MKLALVLLLSLTSPKPKPAPTTCVSPVTAATHIADFLVQMECEKTKRDILLRDLILLGDCRVTPLVLDYEIAVWGDPADVVALKEVKRLCK